MIPNKDLSLKQHAIAPWEPTSSQYYPQLLEAVCNHYGVDMDMPYKDIPQHLIDKVLYGVKGDKIYFRYENDWGQIREGNIEFEGVIRNVERRYKETSSDYIREQMEKYMGEQPCPTCKGNRLKKESLAVLVSGRHISQITDLSIEETYQFFNEIELSEKEMQIGKMIFNEIHERIGFLMNVGLDYLSLGRASGTLSGGEAQRIRLATQIGSKLTGVLYILDEPSIGLHQRDNDRLIETLKHMRDIGNTLIVVEHDEDTMMAADYLIDIGPGAGVHGGQIISAGTPAEV